AQILSVAGQRDRAGTFEGHDDVALTAARSVAARGRSVRARERRGLVVQVLLVLLLVLLVTLVGRVRDQATQAAVDRLPELERRRLEGVLARGHLFAVQPLVR